MHRVITDNDTLKAFCASLKGEAFLTIDTEFIRERTYYPQLCLIQIAGEKEHRAIDPLAPGLDLAPFLDLLRDGNILKVFHASRQDIEIFYRMLHEVPAPLFDTQIAAMVCGHGESVSYETLATKLANAKIDKSSRFSDWAKRPLTQKQIDYALSDVIHLRDVYLLLSQEMQAEGRTEWVKEEMDALLDPSLYKVDPDQVWRKLRLRNRSGKQLAVVQAVARWRELEAQRLDVPRGRLVKDDTLVEIAHAQPDSVANLRQIRGFGNHLKESQCQAIIAAIEAALGSPPEQWPSMPSYKPVGEDMQAVIDLLRLLLKHCAAGNDVVPRLIAGADDIEALVRGRRDGLAMLHGWRYDIFGRKAVELLEGKMSIRVNANARSLEFDSQA
jgi:ribonuclease D